MSSDPPVENASAPAAHVMAIRTTANGSSSLLLRLRSLTDSKTIEVDATSTTSERKLSTNSPGFSKAIIGETLSSKKPILLLLFAMLSLLWRVRTKTSLTTSPLRRMRLSMHMLLSNTVWQSGILSRKPQMESSHPACEHSCVAFCSSQLTF